MHNTKMYSVRNGKVLSIYSAILHDISPVVTKSADNEFVLEVTTAPSGSDKYKVYTFSMNDMEATFDINTDDLLNITLRDTSVHKKVIFTNDKATLVYVRGKDVVGQNSEFIDSTTKEIIHSITINGTEFNTPFNIKDIYQTLTGVDIEEDASGDDIREAKVWYDFFNVSE